MTSQAFGIGVAGLNIENFEAILDDVAVKMDEAVAAMEHTGNWNKASEVVMRKQVLSEARELYRYVEHGENISKARYFVSWLRKTPMDYIDVIEAGLIEAKKEPTNEQTGQPEGTDEKDQRPTVEDPAGEGAPETKGESDTIPEEVTPTTGAADEIDSM